MERFPDRLCGNLLRASFVGLFLVTMGFAQTGCRTTPKIDWNTRVGHFTFDQAVLELGPPDKSATLTDGRVVAEWLTDRGFQGVTYRTSPFYGPYTYGPVVEYYGHPPAPDYFIRLTFDPSGNLADWKQVLK